MTPTAIVAPLGPNPAALTELVWALVRQQDRTISAVHVVLESHRAGMYFDGEMMPPGAAWEQLQRLLGDAVPSLETVRAHHARLPSGEVPSDSHVPGAVRSMTEPLWQAAAAAQAAAPSVVFALSGGRWRASTALVTTIFQLCARPTDRLFEVRVSDEVATGGTGFYFPEQPDGVLMGVGKRQGQQFRPRDIAVLLDPVEVPRLRPLLGGRTFPAFRDAIAASEAAIAAREAPEVEVRLGAGGIFVDGAPLKGLGATHFAFFAMLAAAAAEAAPAIRSLDQDRLRSFLVPWRQRFMGTGLGTPFTSPRSKVVHSLCMGSDVAYNNRNLLSQRWSKLRSRLEELTGPASPRLRRLVPIRRKLPGKDQGGETTWSLDLPADRVRVVS